MARIVICESSGELRHLFERTLARLGHEAAPCGPAAGAWKGADAALVDVDDEGLVHAHGAAAQLPVIACSIYPRGRRSEELAAVAHLVKPFSRSDLERAIGDALHAQMGTIDGCPTTASASTAASA